MSLMKFRKELYSKVALIKAAYNYTDQAYVHLDADSDLKMKEAHILLTTSKEDWKTLGITNEAGRKAYLAGLGRVLTRGASASDPLTGFLRD